MNTKNPQHSGENSIFDVHSYDIDIEANHIYLMGNESLAEIDGNEPGIDYTMSNKFIRNMNILINRSDDPILISMKSCGGDFAEGMAIYDTIMTCPNQICILNYTHASSMSSIIFQAADKRVMMPHSTFMFHDGTMSMQGTCKQYLTEAEELKKTNKIMMDIYIDSMKKKGKYSKWGRQKIHNWLRSQMDKKEEVYLDATQTIEFGFADEIFGQNGKYATWDNLKKF